VNVTFHTTSAIATAAFLSSTQSRPAPDAEAARPSLLIGLIGFVAGVVEHGVMDYVPRTYPIPSGTDVVFSIILFAEHSCAPADCRLNFQNLSLRRSMQ
jgi:hypothetical protein